jgi:hypothetical protein
MERAEHKLIASRWGGLAPRGPGSIPGLDQKYFKKFFRDQVF